MAELLSELLKVFAEPVDTLGKLLERRNISEELEGLVHFHNDKSRELRYH